MSHTEKSLQDLRDTNQMPQKQAIQDWLSQAMAQALNLPTEQLDVRKAFAHYGLSSRQTLMLSGELQTWLGAVVPSTVFYEYANIADLASYLSEGEVVEAVAEQVDAQPGMKVAVVGMACRFPGAPDVDSFWKLLEEGRDAVGEVPADRWDIDAFYDSDTTAPGKVSTRWGGFIDNAHQFDTAFFGISPREAVHMDPQQRLLLHVAAEALEDSGLPAADLQGQQTGVFVGISHSDYRDLNWNDVDLKNIYATTGIAHSVAANRISYVFDFQGPSVAVDTACSSSLVAVHHACRALQNGEITSALVGGSNLILSPAVTMSFSGGGAMAANGRCKAFDASADGYVRSEGAAVVILKPLEQAQRDGDPIYGVILGSAVNQDGRTNGLTAPNPRSQERLLEQAYQRAEVAPNQVTFVECHGTGTELGDPIEAKALGKVLGAGRDSQQPLLIGSVKSNIGHLEAAAGIAGLMKTLLVFRHNTLPASLHYQTPNPHIPFEDLNLQVATQPQALVPREQPFIAGVSSFGFGGTNAHFVLQAPEAFVPVGTDEETEAGAWVLPVSAHTPEALQQRLQQWQQSLSDPADEVADFCYTAAARRDHHDYRVAVWGSDREQLLASLDACLNDAEDENHRQGEVNPAKPPRIAFVCPGQGGEWAGMARQLLATEPVFREKMEACAEAMRAHVDWSLISVIMRGKKKNLQKVEVVHPCLFAIQVSLAALWQSWGIKPAAVVGHSLGELAAVHITGAISLEEGAGLICRRARLMTQASDQGAMALVALPPEQVEERIAPFAGKLFLAVHNGPTSCVISGDAEALAQLREQLDKEEVFNRHVTNVPSHTPFMDAVLPGYAEVLSELQPQVPGIPFYSTVSAARKTDVPDSAYWQSNLTRPVRFAETVQAMVDDGHTLFLELNPHPVLTTAVKQILAQDNNQGLQVQTFGCMRRDEVDQAQMYAAAASLYCVGAPLNWKAVLPRRKHVSLPAYPWQMQEIRKERKLLGYGQGQQGGLPGRRQADTPETAVAVWHTQVNTRALPWLADHRVEGKVTFPAAAYLETALLAAAEHAPNQAVELQDVRFHQALVLNDDSRDVRFRINQRPYDTDHLPGELGANAFDFSFDAAREDGWESHASGRLNLHALGGEAPRVSLQKLSARCATEVNAKAVYADLTARGMEYGPRFQGMRQLWRGDGEALVKLDYEAHGDRAVLHPTLLDAAFQSVVIALQEGFGHAEAMWLPVNVERLRLFAAPKADDTLWVHARLDRHCDAYTPTLKGHLTLTNGDGQILARITGLELHRLGGGVQYHDGYTYQTVYEEAVLEVADDLSTEDIWLVCTNGSLGDSLAEGLREWGATVHTFRPDSVQGVGGFQYALRDILAQPIKGIAYAWGAEEGAQNEAELRQVWEQDGTGLVQLVQALGQLAPEQQPRLWTITRAGIAPDEATSLNQLVHTGLWGLTRSLMYEVPHLRPGLVDVAEFSPETMEALVNELLTDGKDTQVILQGGVRRVPRLQPYFHGIEASQGRGKGKHLEEIPYRLRCDEPGNLDSLYLQAGFRNTVDTHQVEIQVKAAGQNFLDVLGAMGMRPDQKGNDLLLGAECAGIVAAVGIDVTHVKPGQAVFAVAPDCFASHVVVHGELVVPLPEGLDFNAAAALPINYMTAHYAINHQARMRAGESILIHSAASGTGLAALHIARHLGLKVLATAGSEARRDQLRLQGVEHVFDSRSLDFATEVMAATDGKGVDGIFNALAGEAIPAGLAVLRSRGRFMEIGKADIYGNNSLGMHHLRKNISFFAVDLAEIVLGDPAFAGTLLQEVAQLYTEGAVVVPPIESFPINNATAAFRHMAGARHQGKIVLEITSSQDLELVTDLGHQLSRGTHLITGGLGGLGLVVARRLVDCGARRIVLLGRSEPGPEAVAVIRDLAARGVHVHVAQADVTDRDALVAELDWIRENLPPLIGIFHLAGNLADAGIDAMDRETYMKPMATKVLGAWHLHTLTAEDNLDFFVLFSSAAALFGSPGQSNYAAANTFLDTLANWRRAHGQVGHSFSWGPWTEVGLAAQPDRAGRLQTQGIRPFGPHQGGLALSRLLPDCPAHLGLAAIQWDQWFAADPVAANNPFIAHLAEERVAAKPQADSLRKQLEEQPTQRHELLCNYLREALAKVVGTQPEKLSTSKPVIRLGIDSLMAIEMRNRLKSELDLDLPVIHFLQGDNITQLAQALETQIQDQPTASDETTPQLSDAAPEADVTAPDTQSVPPQAEELNTENVEDMVAQLDDLSDEDMNALLLQMTMDQ